MSVVLQFDGSDDRADVATGISNPCPVGKSIIYNGTWKNSGNAFQMFIDIYSGGDFIATNSAGNLRVRINGSLLTGSDAISEGADFKFEIARTSTEYKTYLNNVLQFTHTETDNLDSFLGFSDATFESEGSLANCAVGTTNYYDSDASTHTSGNPVVTDTIAGNNASGVNMPTAALGSPGSAWLEVGGAVVTVTVTETLNSFTDSANVNIDYNVSLAVTEAFKPFTDSAIVSVTSNGSVVASVTETLNPFNDSAVVNVSANISALVTEVLNSFLDGANVTIAKDITLEVTEVFASFTDDSLIKLPTDWSDKAVVVTNYTTQTKVTTNWIDKG